jgi:hypothetical protein
MSDDSNSIPDMPRSTLGHRLISGWFTKARNNLAKTLVVIFWHAIILLAVLLCEAAPLHILHILGLDSARSQIEAVLDRTMLATVVLFSISYLCMLTLSIWEEIRKRIIEEGGGWISWSILVAVLIAACSTLLFVLRPQLSTISSKQEIEPVQCIAKIEFPQKVRGDAKTVPIIFKWASHYTAMSVSFFVLVKKECKYFSQLDDNDLQHLDFHAEGQLDQTFPRSALRDGAHKISIWEQNNANNTINKIGEFPISTTGGN